MTTTLIVGSKNYSSWSMRAGVILNHLGIAYDEIVIPLGQPDTHEKIIAHSPAGLVPILKHDGRTIWDSLAIIEYLAEQLDGTALWPDDVEARTMARAISAEMHAGFAALRRELPMNCRRRYTRFQVNSDAAKDIARVHQIWRDARNRFGRPAGGDFLFGAFGAADAMFAPVASRFATYGVTGDAVDDDYAAAVLGHDAVKKWMDSSRDEPVIDRYEFAD